MDQNQTTLNKLEEYLNNGSFDYADGFDPEDIAVLRRVIAMVRGFDALGSFAGFVSRSIIWVGVVIGGIVALKSGAVDFVLSVVTHKG